MSKRGRKRLRHLLFELAMSLVAKNAEFVQLYHWRTGCCPRTYR
ncbi:IS110 family transposase [Fusobacterium naviforme]|nr:IS110 family transposase [Fusobacterium naviforme]